MDIIILIVAILISLVPSLLLYKWIQKKEKDEKYKKIYKSAFVKGIIAIFPIILTSLIFNIIGRISGLKDLNPLLYQLYYKFIVLAFAEELVKFIMFKNVLKKNKYEYSWYNLTILIVMVGLGFECIENVTFSFGSGIIEMFIKGISLGHAGYGFIMGWFYGKVQKIPFQQRHNHIFHIVQETSIRLENAQRATNANIHYLPSPNLDNLERGYYSWQHHTFRIF